MVGRTFSDNLVLELFATFLCFVLVKKILKSIVITKVINPRKRQKECSLSLLVVEVVVKLKALQFAKKDNNNISEKFLLWLLWRSSFSADVVMNNISGFLLKRKNEMNMKKGKDDDRDE